MKLADVKTKATVCGFMLGKSFVKKKKSLSEVKGVFANDS